MELVRKARFLLRFLFALVKKELVLVAGGLTVGVATVLFFPTVISLIPKWQPPLKIGLVGQYTVDELPEAVLADISYGLTEVKTNGEVVPKIAENWQIGEGGKVYVFRIIPEKFTWHDGQPFRVSDINYNFRDLAYETSENQITFKLQEAFSSLPVVLARPVFKKGLVGLGDYRVKKVETSGKQIRQIILTAANGQKKADKIYRFYSNEKDLKTAFNLGQVDQIDQLFDDSGVVPGNRIAIKKEIMVNGYLALFFNTSQPPFTDKAFRQALAYAVPKESGEYRAYGPFDPRSWAYNPDVKPYWRDNKRARELLAEEESEIVKEKTVLITTLPQYESLANRIKTAWEEIGLKSQVLISSFVPEEFDVLLIAREIPTDPDQYYFWHSTQPGNLARFKSPRIDKLLEDGRKTADKNARKDLYFDFQRFLSEDSPVVFLSHPTVYSVTRI